MRYESYDYYSGPCNVRPQPSKATSLINTLLHALTIHLHLHWRTTLHRTVTVLYSGPISHGPLCCYWKEDKAQISLARSPKRSWRKSCDGQAGMFPMLLHSNSCPPPTSHCCGNSPRGYGRRLVLGSVAVPRGQCLRDPVTSPSRWCGQACFYWGWRRSDVAQAHR